MKIFLLLLLSINSLNSVPKKEWTIIECINHAIEHNHELLSQKLTTKQKQQLVKKTSLSFIPNLNTKSDLSLHFGKSIDPETNNYQNNSYLQNYYSINLSSSIFEGFSKIYRLRIAKQEHKRAELLTWQLKDEIAISTLQKYYDILYAIGRIEITQQVLSESERLFKQKKVEHEIGLSTLSDIELLRSKVSQNRYLLIQEKGEYEKTILALKEQMNYPFDSLLTINTTNLQTIDEESYNPQTIYENAQKMLPNIQIFTKDIEIAKMNLKHARALLYPRINGSAGASTNYSFNINEGAKHAKPYHAQMTNSLGEYVSLSIQIPILNGHSNRTQVKLEKLKLEESKINYSNELQLLHKTILEAVIDYRSLIELKDHAHDNLTSSQLAYKTNYALFQEGIISTIDLQTVLTTLTEAKIEMLKASLTLQLQTKLIEYYNGTPLYSIK